MSPESLSPSVQERQADLVIELTLRLKTEGNSSGQRFEKAARAKLQRSSAAKAVVCEIGGTGRDVDAALFRGRAKRTLPSDRKNGVSYAYLAKAMAPHLSAQAERARQWVPCIVTITRIAPSRKGLDGGDNANDCAKHVRDGVADALAIDDGGSLVEWRYAQEKGSPKTFRVRIEIRKVTQ